MKLRGGDVPDENDATVAMGPSGDADAFQLHRPLSAAVESEELAIVASQVSREFGFYAVFHSQYTGPLITLTPENNSAALSLLEVTLEPLTANSRNLTILLQDQIFSLEVPIAAVDNPFQSLGIRLKSSLLVISLDCVTLDFFAVPVSMMDPTVVKDGRLTIFEDGAIVSI